MHTITKVDTIEELHAHFSQQMPCVFDVKNFFSFHELCTPEWLSSHFGDRLVTIRQSDSKKFVDPSDRFSTILGALRSKRITLADFLKNQPNSGDLLSGTDTYIYTKKNVVNHWQSLWSHAKKIVDHPTPSSPIIPIQSLTTVGFWISKKQMHSLTHYDDSHDHNLNIQLKGQKHFLLFPPKDAPQLNTFLAMSLHPFSFFDNIISKNSSEACHPYQTTLNEGEALFIPSNWFHYVSHKHDLNINLTYWFKPDTYKALPKKSTKSLKNYMIILKLLLAFSLANILSKNK